MIRCWLSLLLLTGTAPAWAQDIRALARTHGWRFDLGSARAEAKRTNKPMFLVFRCEP